MSALGSALEHRGPGVLGSEDLGVFSTARTTVISPRISMAYAAAIGDDNPYYYDDRDPAALRVHPGLCFSLQWAARFRPDLPPNPRAAPFGVHASTDLRLYRPFRAGEAITTQGRVLQKRQLGPGVFTLDRYRFTASDGTLVAELDYNGITRGATLEGGDQSLADAASVPEPVAPAAAPLWRTTLPVPRHTAQRYTECARIYNPIHTEPSVALAAGLPDIILHGSATKAMALSTVVDQCLAGDVRPVTRLYGELRAMVLMDTAIHVECLADERTDSERRIHFRVLNQDGKAALRNGLVCARL